MAQVQESLGNPPRSFAMFPQLHAELQVSILGFVADAPFESLPENYPKSSLTHILPHVCKKFRTFSEADSYWKEAIHRQTAKEPFLWKTALHRISGTDSDSPEYESESIKDLADRAYNALNKPAYKSMYRIILNNHLRFKGPVFYMDGQVQLGEPYALHFFEPRYRLLIAEVMRDQPNTAKNGGRVQGDDAMFIHANRTPLAPTTPATLVQVIRCQMYPDGRADVVLVPKAYVWLENLRIRPNSGHLYYAQCLRMGERVTNEMNQLARRETLANIMHRLAGQFQLDDENEILVPDRHSDESDGD